MPSDKFCCESCEDDYTFPKITKEVNNATCEYMDSRRGTQRGNEG